MGSIISDGNVGLASSGVAFEQLCRDSLEILNSRQQRASDEFRNVVEFDRLIEHRTQESQHSANSAKNRYVNVLPYDHNRVKLASGSTDYINASYVAHSDKLGFDCTYIATQGPLQSTTADFWEMVYEQQCPYIIMLTNLVERGVNKCTAYFPLKLGERLCKGDYEVTVSSVESPGANEQVTVRVLKVTHVPSQQSTSVKHMHYHSWPDHGTPEDCSTIRAMSEQLDSCRDSKRPVVVHCSAGIGRTGTFCAIDILRQRVKALGSQVFDQQQLIEQFDLVKLVHSLRQQRMGMVQTLEQYNFCYHAIVEELLQQQRRLPQSH